MSKPVKLENNELWRLASEITNAAYAAIDLFPADEKYVNASRLRQHAGSLVDEVAQAVGSIDPRDIQYYLGHARRDLFGLKSVYRTSHDVGILKLEPEQMALIDELITKVGARLEAIPVEVKAYFAGLEAPEKTGI